MYRSSFVCLVSKQHQVPEGRVHSYSRSLKGDRQGEHLLSHLICTIVLVSTFSLNWQLQKYEQGCTLFFFFFASPPALLFNFMSHRNRKPQFQAHLMLLIRFYHSSLPAATLLPHLTSSSFTSASPRLDLLELFFHVPQIFLC